MWMKKKLNSSCVRLIINRRSKQQESSSAKSDTEIVKQGTQETYNKLHPEMMGRLGFHKRSILREVKQLFPSEMQP